MKTLKTNRPYVIPSNAGLASTPKAVGRRIGRLLNALSTEINPWVVGHSPIEAAVWEFRTELRRNLIADGWTVTANDAEKGRWEYENTLLHSSALSRQTYTDHMCERHAAGWRGKA